MAFKQGDLRAAPRQRASGFESQNSDDDAHAGFSPFKLPDDAVGILRGAQGKDAREVGSRDGKATKRFTARNSYLSQSGEYAAEYREVKFPTRISAPRPSSKWVRAPPFLSAQSA
jgi:hypothetical protein